MQIKPSKLSPSRPTLASDPYTVDPYITDILGSPSHVCNSCRAIPQPCDRDLYTSPPWYGFRANLCHRLTLYPPGVIDVTHIFGRFVCAERTKLTWKGEWVGSIKQGYSYYLNGNEEMVVVLSYKIKRSFALFSSALPPHPLSISSINFDIW